MTKIRGVKQSSISETKKRHPNATEDVIQPSDVANRGLVSQSVRAFEGDIPDTETLFEEREFSGQEEAEVVHRTPLPHRYAGDSDEERAILKPNSLDLDIPYLRDASLDTLEHRYRVSIRAYQRFLTHKSRIDETMEISNTHRRSKGVSKIG